MKLDYKLIILSDISPGNNNCSLCKRNFNPSAQNRTSCGACEIWANCTNCKNPVQIKRRLEKAIKRGTAFCSYSCSSKFLSGSIDCVFHGKQETSFKGTCNICRNAKHNIAIVCHIHGKQKSSFSGVCHACMKIGQNDPILCDIHGEQKSSQNGVCRVCGNIPVNCDIHGEQETSNWGSCWLCIDKLIGIPSWQLENDCDLHQGENRQIFTNKKYNCWSCIKFNIHLKSIDLKIPKSFLQATYRENEFSSKGQFAMEQQLIELNISWLTYIKFYKDKNGFLKPLVVGKSGSKLVNKSGTDINFMYEGKNPGRSFLRESCLKWDHSQVLIIPADSEFLAYKKEKELGEKYGLFQS